MKETAEIKNLSAAEELAAKDLRITGAGNCDAAATCCFLADNTSVYALVPAAGSGSRMGRSDNKPFLNLAGVPAIVRTLRVLSSCSCIQGIVVLAKSEEVAQMKSLLMPEFADRIMSVEAGGATRQDSVFKGLRYLEERLNKRHKKIAETNAAIVGEAVSDPLIAIHDGARCLITQEVICRTLRHGADIAPCAAAVPVKDTIKIADKVGRVERTLDRSHLYAVQTPQVGRLSVYLSAFSQAAENGFVATDDMSVLEAAGIEVDLVPGDEHNLKLTTPADLVIAEALLEARN